MLDYLIMETLSHPELLELFGGSDFDRMAVYIASCPVSPQRPLALQSIALKHPRSALLALYGLVSDYAHQGYYDYTRLLGRVQYNLIVLRLLQTGQSGETDLLEYLSSAIQHVAKAYFDDGNFNDLLDYAESVEQEMNQMGFTQVLPPMLLYKVEGLIFSERVEEAVSVFETLRNYEDFLPLPKNKEVINPTMIQRDSIGRKLDQLVISVRTLANKAQEKPNDELNNAIQRGLTVFQTILSDQSEESSLPVSKVVETLNEIKNAEWVNATDPTAFLKHDISGMDAFTEMARPFLTSSNDSRLSDMQQFVEHSGQLLVQPETARNPDSLRANLHEIRQWQPYAKRVRPDDYHTLLWMAGVSLYRLNEYSKAIEQFEELWQLQEIRRLGIADYNRRAGILSQFPHLFALLCDCYYQTGDAPGLLRAMEASKGRVLADWLDKRADVLTSPLKINHQADYLPDAMRQYQANYLSFFVDDDFSFAVLVSKTGEYFMQQVPIGKSKLGSWVDEERTNPSKGVFPSTFYKASFSTSELLTPFVNWLQPLLTSGVMHTGDHICYCPDGDLHLFPLHYVRFQENYLIDTFSLSRTQGVASMLDIQSKPTRHIDQFLLIQASAALDDPDKKTAFGEVGNWLTKQFNGQKLVNEQADVEQTVIQLATGRLIHFSTHGYFPTKASNTTGERPYYDSGLLLYHEGQPPVNTIESDWEIREPFLLSPDRLLRATWNMEGSHVTIQACVSGQAKEGIGGDALGLDWALLQLGASSLLSTGWNVDVYWANDFCRLFYEAWQNGQSKADAHRLACLALKEKRKNETAPGDLTSPYYWAAFSLTGDWR